MYIFLIVLIFIASVLLVLSVLAQNPKSGMAANFGASNAVMGVRQTANFLEKFTWGLSISIVVLSLAATMAMPSTTQSNAAQHIRESISTNAESEALTFDAPAVTNEAVEEAVEVEEVPAN